MSRNSVEIPKSLRNNSQEAAADGNEKYTKPRRSNGCLVFSVVIFELIVIAFLFGFNYMLRYDQSIRYNSDMSEFPRVLLTCDPTRLDYELSRPFYSYEWKKRNSTEGLELTYGLPEWVFFVCLIITPTLIFCVCDIVRCLLKHNLGSKAENSNWDSPQLFHLWKVIGGYLIGLSVTGVLVSVLKMNLVSPRPHFMSVCFADTKLPLVPSACRSEVLWSPAVECTNRIVEDILEAMKGFPSYHAALAIYGGIFTSIYVCIVTISREVFAGQMIVVLGIMSMSVLGATHRLSSGQSFPKDILGGAFIGLLMACYMVKYLMNYFMVKKYISTSAVSPSLKKTDTDKIFVTDSIDLRANEMELENFSADYEKMVDRIDSVSFLPRLKSDLENRNSSQAHNPSAVVNERMISVQTTPTIPSRREPQVKESPSFRWTWYSQNTSNRPYSIPRKRLGSYKRYEVSEGAYTNYGFTGDRQLGEPTKGTRRKTHGVDPSRETTSRV